MRDFNQMLLPVLLPTGFEPTKGVVVHSNPLDRVRNAGVDMQRSRSKRQSWVGSMELSEASSNALRDRVDEGKKSHASKESLNEAEEILFFDAVEDGTVAKINVDDDSRSV